MCVCAGHLRHKKTSSRVNSSLSLVEEKLRRHVDFGEQITDDDSAAMKECLATIEWIELMQCTKQPRDQSQYNREVAGKASSSRSINEHNEFSAEMNVGHSANQSETHLESSGVLQGPIPAAIPTTSCNAYCCNHSLTHSLAHSPLFDTQHLL